MPPRATVSAERRQSLRPLFSSHQHLRAVIDAVLEARHGEALADDLHAPRVARLDVGCYAIFGGDPELESASHLVEAVEAPRELVFDGSAAWEARLVASRPEKLSDRSMSAYSPDPLRPEALRPRLQTLPQGFELRRIDVSLASQLGTDLQPNALQVFPDTATFARLGMGVGATHEGRLVCVASSYTASSDKIEVAISTHPAYRRRGLAEGVAAGLLVACLDAGIAPHWSAANPVSQRLALRLGYQWAGTVHVLA